jgi:hypothetical protein
VAGAEALPPHRPAAALIYGGLLAPDEGAQALVFLTGGLDQPPLRNVGGSNYRCGRRRPGRDALEPVNQSPYA